jgi:streptomycin 6-kinase
MKIIKETRERFGRFFYRFPEGESAADVFDRISGNLFLLESFHR